MKRNCLLLSLTTLTTLQQCCPGTMTLSIPALGHPIPTLVVCCCAGHYFFAAQDSGQGDPVRLESCQIPFGIQNL